MKWLESDLQPQSRKIRVPLYSKHSGPSRSHWGLPDAADACGGRPDKSARRRERVALLLFLPGSLH